MAGAPQTRRPLPNWGVTRPLLILILLLAGSQCSQTPPEGCAPCTTPSPPPPPEPPKMPTPVIVTTGSPLSPSCSPAPPQGWLRVWGGPPSRERPVGTPLTLECHFRGPPDTALTWLQACPPGLGEVPRSCPWPQEVVATRGGRRMDRVVQEGGGSSTLTFPKLSHNDSGLFFCRVESGEETAQSCGTFVRVLEALGQRAAAAPRKNHMRGRKPLRGAEPGRVFDVRGHFPGGPTHLPGRGDPPRRLPAGKALRDPPKKGGGTPWEGVWDPLALLGPPDALLW
ncbi:uncharacterized protein LOC135405515 isoform X1 [Pseudopipra pipra]|uniref:uncharacterized protein LOC135405515 isoform X1 n=1 Tax=Pseudopipra pipra TaxID=415032 RepID=UPI00313A30B7